MRLTLKLRTLLLAVGCVAVVIWLAVDTLTYWRRDYFRTRADSFAFGEADVLESIARNLEAARLAESEGSEGVLRASTLRADAERLARIGAWHVRMERKYGHAADHPWRSLPPDDAPPLIPIP